MKPKKKKCKGNYRINHFGGCGQIVYTYKYGLCKKCFNFWLTSTKQGSEYIQKQIIPQAKKKIKRDWQKEKKQIKEKLKTHKDFIQDLQKVFNTYIRLRDQNKGCISCGQNLSKKYDAGHYFSVGKYPNLRFDEDNVHAQCVHCNQHLHGNIAEYSIRLSRRIGKQRFESLIEKRKTTLKLSIPEIKEKIEHYKKLINKLL